MCESQTDQMTLRLAATSPRNSFGILGGRSGVGLLHVEHGAKTAAKVVHSQGDRIGSGEVACDWERASQIAGTGPSAC